MGKILIEAESIVEVAKHAYHEWELAMGAAENSRQVNWCYKMQELCKAVQAVAEAAPAVDAVPVIRCRDCCYAEASEHPGCIVCTAWGCRSELDGYCHQAERK